MSHAAGAGQPDLLVALFEASADATLVVDEAGLIVASNPAAARMLGYSAAALHGRSVDTLVPARFQHHTRQRSGYQAAPEPRPMGRGLELFARCADGREIPVDISLTPVVVGGRRLVGCALRDQRGRAHGTGTLNVQATALRSAANGIVITDRSGVITWVNPAACAITGYASDELVGQHTRVLKSGQHDPAFYAELWQAVTAGKTWCGTIVNRRKDGTLYHEEQTIAPVVDDGGAVTHFIAIKQDVSDAHRTREALVQAHRELAARVSEIESLAAQLREQAIRDPLTNLYNRRYLEESLRRELARVRRSGEPLVVAMLDVDRFKLVNDGHGHATGDAVLQKLAEQLRSHVRDSDLVGRIGGEEFVIVLVGASLAIARQRAEQWRASFAASSVPAPGGASVRCTLSIGLALRHGDEPPEALLRRADTALYQAKAAGRDRVVIAD